MVGYLNKARVVFYFVLNSYRSDLRYFNMQVVFVMCPSLHLLQCKVPIGEHWMPRTI